MQPFRSTLGGELPDRWLLKESVTLLSPDGQANVIASSEPLDVAMTTEHYARAQGELLETEFPGYTEIDAGQIDAFGGQAGYYRIFEWLPPDREPIMQFQLYHAEGRRGYTATGTTTVVSSPTYREQLLSIMERLTIVREQVRSAAG